MAKPFIIEMKGVTKSFGRKPVLNSVDLAVPLGQTFAFLGRNGAGKTTTIRTLLGLLKPDDGEEIQVQNGFAYMKMTSGRIELFNLEGDHPLGLTAHFAAPGNWLCIPTDDGRVIAVGPRRIALLGPPPNRGS